MLLSNRKTRFLIIINVCLTLIGKSMVLYNKEALDGCYIFQSD